MLETARVVFRQGGFDDVSIDQLMKAAGLTRGAFYAHFDSKEHLVREVLGIEAGLTRTLAALATDAPARPDASELLEAYLHDDPAGRVQCPVVAHPMDALRGGTGRSEAYAQQIGALTAALEGAGVVGDAGGEDEAALLAALTVGAAVLGTAMGDASLGRRIERAASAEIRRRLAPS